MTPGSGAGFLVPAILCWLATVYCLVWQRGRPWHPAIAALVFAFIARGAASLLGDPVVYRAIDRLFGTTNLPRLLVNSMMILWSLLTFVSLLHWSLSTSAARRATRWLLLVAVTIVIISTVLWHSEPVPSTAVSFSQTHGQALAVAAFMLLYHVPVAASLTGLGMCCTYFAYRAHQWRYQFGMSLTATGCVLYLLFAGHRILAIIGGLVGWTVASWSMAIPLVTGTATVLIMVGLTAPMWCTDITELFQRYTARRHYAAMEPLWSALSVAHVGVRLDPLGIPDEDLRYSTYRRVIEIRDGLLSISHLMHSEDHSDGYATQQEGLGGQDTPKEPLSAALVASRIDLALCRLTTHTSPSPQERSHPDYLSGPPEASDEQWLAEVSREYEQLTRRKRSGIVQDRQLDGGGNE